MASRFLDIADFDEVTVQRVILGDHPNRKLHSADVAEVVRRMSLDCFSAGQIAFRLKMSRRAVQHWRQRFKIDLRGNKILQDAPTICRKVN